MISLLDGEAGAQRGQGTCPRSHSKYLAELGYTPRVAGSKDYALYNMLSWFPATPR